MKMNVVIAVVIVLVAVVAGCGGAHRYDGRLVLADSLMQAHPDSALALIEAIGPDGLSREGDHAYRDLLLTQARYKCYLPATSDSAINRALGYYRTHPADREKLTRAYIYKGAVLEELHHPDSAMQYYKTAEAVADTTDYANLGYTKLQMGALMNNYFIMDSQDVLKYEEALDCFRLADDSVYILICMNNLGCLYRESKPDKAESLLLESYALARQLKDTTRIAFNGLSLVLLYEYQGKLEEAHKHIIDVSDLGFPGINYSMCFSIAKVYARLGQSDSAQMYFNMAQQRRTGDDALFRMYQNRCLSVMALTSNDTISSLRFEKESKRIEDSLMFNAKI